MSLLLLIVNRDGDATEPAASVCTFTYDTDDEATYTTAATVTYAPADTYTYDPCADD